MAHAVLWVIGLLLSFKGFESGDIYKSQLFGLGCVLFVFIFEIAITYFDLFTQRDKYEATTILKKVFVVFVAAFVLIALTVMVIVLLAFHDNYNNIGLLFILFLLLTTGLKFLEIWLPNNIESTEQVAKKPLVPIKFE